MKKISIIIFVLLISIVLLAEEGTVELNLLSSFADSVAVPEPINYDFFVMVDGDTVNTYCGTIAPQTTTLQIDYSTPIAQETEEQSFIQTKIYPNPARILKYKSGSNPQPTKCLLSQNAKIITDNKIAVYNIKGQKIAENSSNRSGTLELNNAFGIYFIKNLDKTQPTGRSRQIEFLLKINGSERTFPMEYSFNNLEQIIKIPRKKQIQVDATGITAAKNDTPIDSVYVFTTFEGDVYYKKVANGSLINIITGDESESFLHKDGYFGLMINSNRETLFPDEIIFPKDTKNIFGKQALAHIPESVLTEPEMRIVNHAAAFGGTYGVSYHLNELVYQVQYQESMDLNINFEQALDRRNGFVQTFNRLIKRILGDDNWTEDDLYNVNQETGEVIFPINADDTNSPVHYFRLQFLEEGDEWNEIDVIAIQPGSPSYGNHGFHSDGCSTGGSAHVFFSNPTEDATFAEIYSSFAPNRVNDDYIKQFTLFGAPSWTFPIDQIIGNLVFYQNKTDPETGLIIGHPGAVHLNSMNYQTDQEGNIIGNLQRETRYPEQETTENYYPKKSDYILQELPQRH